MKIKVLGNYKPSKHSCGRIIDKNGIAPTVMDNHGCVNVITTDDEGLTNDEIIEQVNLFIKMWSEVYGRKKEKSKNTKINTKGMCKTYGI